jgi:serine/threonine protein kinase
MSGVGTRRYMAPEIVNNGRYNLKADVFSWSIVFWEILSLSKPYASYSTDDHRREVCRGGERPVLKLQWPSWIHNLLRLSWEDNVDCRFSMQEVYDYLQASLTTEKQNINSDLYITNHDNLIQKEFATPESPTAIQDFHTVASVGTKSSDDMAGSINHFPELYEDSPPPAPKRLTAFLNLPEIIVRNIALPLPALFDNEVSGFYSRELDESFTDHIEGELWG